MQLSIFLDSQDAAQQVNHHKPIDQFIRHGRVEKINTACFVMLLKNLGLNQSEGHYPLVSLLAKQEQKIDSFDARKNTFLAQPVSLMLQRDTVALTEIVTLTGQAFDSLTTLLNAHFLEDGIVFIPSDTQQYWYVTLPASDVHTFLPQQAMLQDAHDYQPTGEGARRLKQIMNETQMLLHEHAINQDRAENGLQPCNSIWLSANGDMQSNITPKYDLIIGDTPLLEAVHHQTGVALVDSFDDMGKAHQNIMHYTDTVSSVDWLQLYQMVKRWQLRDLNIYLPFGAATLNLSLKPLDCLKFWQQPKTFEQLVATLSSHD